MPGKLATSSSRFLPLRAHSLRRLAAGVACLSMGASGTFALGVASAPPAAAAAAPFACRTSTDLYNLLSNLYESPETTGAPHFTLVGTASQDYNGIGFDPFDSFIYGFSATTNHLLKIDSSGGVAADGGGYLHLRGHRHLPD